MKKTSSAILTLALLFMSSVGYACESYEECIKDASKGECFSPMGESECEGYNIEQSLIINKAIAYKLSDIEKELKKMNEPDVLENGVFTEHGNKLVKEQKSFTRKSNKELGQYKPILDADK